MRFLFCKNQYLQKMYMYSCRQVKLTPYFWLEIYQPHPLEMFSIWGLYSANTIKGRTVVVFWKIFDSSNGKTSSWVIVAINFYFTQNTQCQFYMNCTYKKLIILTSALSIHLIALMKYVPIDPKICRLNFWCHTTITFPLWRQICSIVTSKFYRHLCGVQLLQ